MASSPYIAFSNVFNPADFTLSDGNLTLSSADQRYVKIGSFGTLSALSVSGNVDAGSLTIAGLAIATAPTYTIGITPGTSAASKALVLDSTKGITGFNINDHDGSSSGLSLGGILITAAASELNYVDTTAGTAQASKALVLDSSRSITNINQLTASRLISNGGGVGFQCIDNASGGRATMEFTNNSRTMEIGLRGTGASAPQNSFYIYGSGYKLVMELNGDTTIGAWVAASGYKLNVLGSINATSYYLNGSNIDFSGNTYTTGITAGIATASKALVLNSSLDISGINSIGASTISINRMTSGQVLYSASGTSQFRIYHNLNADAQVGTLSNNDFYLFSNNALRINVGATGITNIIDHNGSSLGLALGGTLITATAGELNYVDITTIGAAQASKALIVDTNRDINNINALTAATLTGTLQTAAQPNITSVGTLTSLTASGSIISSTRLACVSGVYPYLDLIRAGTGDIYPDWRIENSNGLKFQKSVNGGAYSDIMVITDSAAATINGTLSVSGGISGTLSTAAQPNITSLGTLSSLTATSITGTLQTAAQPNITSIGTLPSLSVSSTINSSISIKNTAAVGLANIKFSNDTTFNAEVGVRGSNAVGSLSNYFYMYYNSNYVLRVVDTTNEILLGSSAVAGGYAVSIGGSIKCTSLTGTLSTAAQPNITSVGTLSSLTISGDLNATLTTAAQPNITSLGTLTSLTVSGNLNATLTTAAQPNITSVGTLTSLSTGPITLGGTLITSTADEINYTDIATLGTFQSSKAMTLDSSGIGLMGLGTSVSNCLRFYGSTLNRETVNLFRASDTEGLTIASHTTSASNSKVYPMLTLISTDNASTFIGGVSTTTADLLNIQWNDKPTSGFDSQIHRLCFNVGNTRPFKSGYPYSFGVITSADAVCIGANATTATPSSACLYVISDTQSKLLFNTDTPYTSGSYGTAAITFNNSNLSIKASNSLNANSTLVDMPLKIDSSRSSNAIQFCIQISNEDRSDTTKSASIGTLSNSDFCLLTNNVERVRVTSSGRMGIGNQSPRCPFEVSGTTSFTMGFGGTATGYYYNNTSGSWSNMGLGPVTASNVSGYFGGNIYALGMYASSDRRLKADISDLSIEFERYQQLKPSIYRFKTEDKFRMGLIAQDALDTFAELVSFSENENMEPSDDQRDLAGIQLSIDYQQLTTINCSMIKKLITQVESQSEEIRLLKEQLASL